jgi:hypothetical protein
VAREWHGPLASPDSSADPTWRGGTVRAEETGERRVWRAEEEAAWRRKTKAACKLYHEGDRLRGKNVNDMANAG